MARPKRAFSAEEEQKIEEFALCNCQNRTISTALNIPIHTLERRYGTKIRRWRAEYKVELRQNQQKLSQTSADMLKFLGKNILNQTDKQVIETSATIKEYSEAELEAGRAASRTYKLRLACGGSQEADRDEKSERTGPDATIRTG